MTKLPVRKRPHPVICDSQTQSNSPALYSMQMLSSTHPTLPTPVTDVPVKSSILPNDASDGGNLLNLDSLAPSGQDYRFMRFPSAIATAQWMFHSHPLKPNGSVTNLTPKTSSGEVSDPPFAPCPSWTPFLQHLHTTPPGPADTIWPQLLPHITDPPYLSCTPTPESQPQSRTQTNLHQSSSTVKHSPIKSDPDASNTPGPPISKTASQRVKRHQCEHCPKRFHRSSDLVKHRRTHTGEKPFVCHHCGRAFADSSSLSAHRRIHTGERPYTCAHCGRGFSVSSSLVKHRRIHTGEKPYQCTMCGRTFSDGSSLGAHKKRSCPSSSVSMVPKQEFP